MLNPALLSEEQKTGIMEKFSALTERGIADINQDLNDPIRQEFDRTVLNAFGIGNYLDRIVGSLKTMRRIRKAVKQRAAELRPLRGSESRGQQMEEIVSIAADNGYEN